MNLYTEKVINKFSDALKAATDRINAGEAVKVTISSANSKMGAVASVSLLPFLTCPSRCSGTCGKECYAAKLANLRPSVLQSYAMNTAILLHKPEIYWATVDLACKSVKYFRFHVSGDIVDADYFAHMIRVAKDNATTEILVFTKRYEIVNAWIQENGALPKNLHVLFSGWAGLDTVNPFGLPETNVILKGCEPADGWKMCGGNCFNCACRGVGCWQAQSGDVIAFNIH